MFPYTHFNIVIDKDTVTVQDVLGTELIKHRSDLDLTREARNPKLVESVSDND